MKAIRRINIYSDAFDFLDRSNAEEGKPFFDEWCDILQTSLGKSCRHDMVVQSTEIPVLIGGIEARLRVLLSNRPSQKQTSSPHAIYTEKVILGQTIRLEGPYDRMIGALESWKNLCEKALANSSPVEFLFSECDLYDGPLLAKIRLREQISFSELRNELRDRYASESDEEVRIRLQRIMESGLAEESIHLDQTAYRITSKGKKVVL